MSTSPRDQSKLFSNAPPVSSTTQALRPREHVWTLRRDAGELRAELLGHGEYGWELQLLRDGAFMYGRLYALRGFAEAEAAACRAQLEAEGWRE